MKRYNKEPTGILKGRGIVKANTIIDVETGEYWEPVKETDTPVELELSFSSKKRYSSIVDLHGNPIQYWIKCGLYEVGDVVMVEKSHVVYQLITDDYDTDLPPSSDAWELYKWGRG